MITYCEQTKTFYLETENTSYVFRVLENGILAHSYYGVKIPREDISWFNTAGNPNFSPRISVGERSISPEDILYECPTFGRGDFRTPGVVVEGTDGTWVNELAYVSHRILPGKPAILGLPQLDVNVKDLKTLEVTLEDCGSGFQTVLYYTPFPDCDVIARRTVVRNISDRTVTLRSVASANVDFEDGDFEMITLEGAWARERAVERHPLYHGISQISSRRGASSHQLNPFTALVGKDTNEDQGSAYGFSLVYSGDFRILAEVEQMDAVRVQLGLNPETFSWVLNPGESFEAPEAILTYSNQGLNKMSQNFHAVCRGHLGKSADKNLKHPIIINSWEAMYFEFNEEKMLKFVDDCAGLGIDTVVMDDGWFGHRDTDNSSLGDWFIYERKLPNGLVNIINACHEKGMNFGIWFEPEMISKDSKLFEAHPDWCIHTPGHAVVEARQQLILDMSRPEVVDCIYGQIATILDRYDISYIKWDMNRHMTDNGSAWLAGRQGEFSHRYILGVYALMNRLVTNYPGVFFEGCSGGGGRFDFGMLYYTSQIWTSDDSDAKERLKIQYGTSFAYPPAAMVAHVSDCPNHQTGRTTPFATRGDVAQMCSFGYEFDAGKLSQAERDQIKTQIVKHRELEELVNSGTYWRLRDPFNSDFCAWSLVSADKKKAWAMFAFPQVSPHPKTQYLRFRGLDADTRYHIPQLDITASGAVLMQVGIPVNQTQVDYVTFTYDLIAE